MQNDDILLNLKNEMNALLEVEALIFDILKNNKNDFLPIKQVIKKIPIKNRKLININLSMNDNEMAEEISRCLGQKLILYESQKGIYITLNVPFWHTIVNVLKQKPDISINMLKKTLPLTNNDFIDALNTAIEKGCITFRITNKMTVSLFPTKKKPE